MSNLLSCCVNIETTLWISIIIYLHLPNSQKNQQNRKLSNPNAFVSLTNESTTNITWGMNILPFLSLSSLYIRHYITQAI